MQKDKSKKVSSKASSDKEVHEVSSTVKKDGEFFAGLNRLQKGLLNGLMVVVLMVLSVLVYNSSLQLYYNSQKAVGTVNGQIIKMSDVSATSTATITAEQVLDYGRKKLVITAMDKLKIPQVTDAQLESKKSTYIGTSDWTSIAKQQNSTEAKVKEDVKFLIRVGLYREKVLGAASANLVAPAAPSKPTSETTAAYNKAMTEYQAKSSAFDAKWKKTLNAVFAKGKITIFTLAVQ